MTRAFLLLLLLAGCGARSESDEPAPCETLEWSPEWCDARGVHQDVVLCPDNPGHGTLDTSTGIWSNAPRAACAPAEHASVDFAWCCW